MKYKFTISIAQHTIQFQCSNKTLFFHLFESYKEFHNQNVNANFNIFIKSSKKNIYFEPSTNIKRKTGLITTPPSKKLDLRELHFNIKIILAQLLVDKGLILLHASGFIKNNKMCIMSAPSGVGKSTVCMIAKNSGYEIVCDDSVLIEVRSTKIYAHTTPYVETHKKKSRPNTYEIYGIYFLHQDKNDKCKKQILKDSVTAILNNTYIFQNTMKDNYVKNYFEMAFRIALHVKTYDLFFTKSSNFLKLI